MGAGARGFRIAATWGKLPNLAAKRAFWCTICDVFYRDLRVDLLITNQLGPKIYHLDIEKNFF
jgi:hypothetical protein